MPVALRRAALLFVAIYAVGFAYAAADGRWLLDQAGRGVATDFASFWSAGRLALDGAPAAAYDWAAQRATQTEGLGATPGGWLPFAYPPTLLLILAPFAALPYAASLLAFMAATLPLYAAAIRAVAPATGAVAAALAFPGAALNFGYGQTGFLVAALIGGGLALLDRKPVAAGILFGLLTFKPQFGLLIPLALAAGGHWRAFAAAAGSAAAFAAVSAAILGPESWAAFLASARAVSQGALVDGLSGYGKMLSAFGLTRYMGGSLLAGLAVQGAVSLALACAVWRTWRGDAPYPLKAALLAVAAVAATPYVYGYDLVVLAVPIAFMARAPFADRERQAVGAACLLIVLGQLFVVPLGLASTAIVAMLVFARLRSAGAGNVLLDPARRSQAA